MTVLPHRTAVVTPALVTTLIEQQFPTLVPASVIFLGSGWDNSAYLINEQIVFRFPHHDYAAKILLRETTYLPLLAPQLPLPIPIPSYCGQPTNEFPFAFIGYQHLSGRTADHLALPFAARPALVPALATFLRTLHHLTLDPMTQATAPGDEIGRNDLSPRAARLCAELQTNTTLNQSLRTTVCQTLTALAAAPAATAHCWVHGDLYARHLLLDDTGTLTGIIDWGDLHWGDPALDLSLVYSFLPPDCRANFRALYGPVPAATWQRARFRALHYGVILSHYGASSDDPVIGVIGHDALHLALTLDDADPQHEPEDQIEQQIPVL